MGLYPKIMDNSKLIELETERQSIERQLENCHNDNYDLICRISEVENEIKEILNDYKKEE